MVENITNRNKTNHLCSKTNHLCSKTNHLCSKAKIHKHIIRQHLDMRDSNICRGINGLLRSQ